MEGCSERSFCEKLGIVFILWACVSQICVAFSGGNCSLPNGIAYPAQVIGTEYYYYFKCKSGFDLVGLKYGPCHAGRPQQFCQYKKCTKTYPCKTCIDDYGSHYSHDWCMCHHILEAPIEWQCTRNGWIPYYSCFRLGASTRPFMKISYTSSPQGLNYYVHGTIATYSCITNHRFAFNLLTRSNMKCLNGTWSGPEPRYTMCACKELSDTDSVEYSDTSVDHFYPIGTTASKCGGSFVGSICTTMGWDPCSALSTTESISPATEKPTEHHQPTKHHQDEEKTLIIVSGTTGAILGTLIVLVVIVTCQRRLHYYRMRRARLRCRQDQDAFTAYITYQRDVRFMLPSYDEAVNQQEQGQPPTFAEAIASNAEGGSPSAATSAERSSPNETNSPPPFADDVSILVPLDPEVVGVSSEEDDGQAPRASSAEGRFFRAVRTLFGGRSFTPRAIYCHLVPDGGEDDDNGRGVQRQSSQPDGGSDGLNNGGAETGNESQSLEVDSPDSDQATRDLNELLSRAGLC